MPWVRCQRSEIRGKGYLRKYCVFGHGCNFRVDPPNTDLAISCHVHLPIFRAGLLDSINQLRCNVPIAPPPSTRPTTGKATFSVATFILEATVRFGTPEPERHVVFTPHMLDFNPSNIMNE
jgi:hypothetical protein